jgi:probable rRNA maturation factor
MMVRVLNRAPKKIKVSRVKKIVSEALKAEGVKRGEVSVVVCDDCFIKELNKKYRGIDEPTDVLAFPFTHKSSFKSPKILGEIIVSLEAAEKQAAAFNHTPEEEFALLLVHGALHIVGYEDSGAKEERMRKREREIFEKVKSF